MLHFKDFDQAKNYSSKLMEKKIKTRSCSIKSLKFGEYFKFLQFFVFELQLNKKINFVKNWFRVKIHIFHRRFIFLPENIFNFRI